MLFVCCNKMMFVPRKSNCMKLFRSSSPAWPPTWTFDAGVYIWRVLFSNAGEILGEARDPEKKETWFFCLEEATGTLLWRDLRHPEAWWTGIEAIEGGRFFLHGFRKPDMPQHLGIRAHDLHSGTLLWSSEEYTFLLAQGDDVYASREKFSGLEFYRLSAVDGGVTEELGQDTSRINDLRQQQNEEDFFRGYRYPDPLSDAHPHADAARSALDGIVDPAQVAGNLDVLVEAPLLFAAWHIAEERPENGRPSLKQEFLALNTDSGKTLFRGPILTGADAPGMDSFFIKDHQLIYIHERCAIHAHDLNGAAS